MYMHSYNKQANYIQGKSTGQQSMVLSFFDPIIFTSNTTIYQENTAKIIVHEISAILLQGEMS